MIDFDNLFKKAILIKDLNTIDNNIPNKIRQYYIRMIDINPDVDYFINYIIIHNLLKKIYIYNTIFNRCIIFELKNGVCINFDVYFDNKQEELEKFNELKQYLNNKELFKYAQMRLCQKQFTIKSILEFIRCMFEDFSNEQIDIFLLYIKKLRTTYKKNFIIEDIEYIIKMDNITFTYVPYFESYCNPKTVDMFIKNFGVFINALQTDGYIENNERDTNIDDIYKTLEIAYPNYNQELFDKLNCSEFYKSYKENSLYFYISNQDDDILVELNTLNLSVQELIRQIKKINSILRNYETIVNIIQ